MLIETKHFSILNKELEKLCLGLPVVLIFAPKAASPQKSQYESFAIKNGFDCRYYASDENLNQILARERPDVIVSFGKRENYPHLQKASFTVQKKRLHFENLTLSELNQAGIGKMIYGFFLHRALSFENESRDKKPLVSVFTPAFRTGEERFCRAYQSLLSQTYTNWEWIVVDDSDDEQDTFRLLNKIAAEESRLSIYSAHQRSGKIGEVKRRACALAQGEILVELDHDDELTPNAISDIVQTFLANPQAGFIYSDWAEISDDSGLVMTYPDGWAFGYGDYRTEIYNEREIAVAKAPPINSETVRHIVGMPNHVRAWRRSEYWRIGGHNPNLYVADDYELMVRTFLQTEMLHLPKLCYIQHFSAGKNTQDFRRAEIQRMVYYIFRHFEQQIQTRLMQLNSVSVDSE